MKSIPIAIAGLTLLASGALFAQRAVQATVPFDFYVGSSQLLPSGTYRVAPCGALMIQVRNCTESTSAMNLVGLTGEQGNGDASLVFHRYGDTYFLTAVNGPGKFRGMMLPKSKHEKEHESELATVRTTETITVPKQAPPPQQ